MYKVHDLASTAAVTAPHGVPLPVPRSGERCHLHLSTDGTTVTSNSGSYGASGGGVVCLGRSGLGTAPAASSAPDVRVDSTDCECEGSSLGSALVGEHSTLRDGLPAAVPAAAAAAAAAGATAAAAAPGGPANARMELRLLKLHSTTPLAAA